MTPTQRTLAALKRQGKVCGIVERWIPRNGVVRGAKPGLPGIGGFRLDLFGIIDVIAIDRTAVTGVQSCGNSYAPHWRTLTEEKALSSALWLLAPGTTLELWAWRKVKLKRGGKAMRWAPRVKVITLNHLPSEATQEAKRILAKAEIDAPAACASTEL